MHRGVRCATCPGPGRQPRAQRGAWRKPPQWEGDGQSAPGAGLRRPGGAEEISVTDSYLGHLRVGVLQVNQECSQALPHLAFIKGLPPLHAACQGAKEGESHSAKTVIILWPRNPSVVTTKPFSHGPGTAPPRSLWPPACQVVCQGGGLWQLLLQVGCLGARALSRARGAAASLVP